MPDFLESYYLWIKALHIIAVTFWMAGMFYLPRLFVYHAEVKPGSEADGLFKVMERRLLRLIINPAMIATLVLGIALLFVPDLIDFKSGWLHVKLFCVLVLVAFHAYLSNSRKKFEKNLNTKSPIFYRKINEIGPVVFIVIVIMVVLKPF